MTCKEISVQEDIPYVKVWNAARALEFEMKPGRKGTNFNVKQTEKIINVLKGKSKSVLALKGKKLEAKQEEAKEEIISNG